MLTDYKLPFEDSYVKSFVGFFLIALTGFAKCLVEHLYLLVFVKKHQHHISCLSSCAWSVSFPVNRMNGMSLNCGLALMVAHN